MPKSVMTLALAGVVVLGFFSAATAQDNPRSVLRDLRSVPASAYDVGVLRVERLMSGLDNDLWSFTYDLSDYGDDDDSYSMKSDNINYRYGYAQYARESDKLMLIGVALAEGTYMAANFCSMVLDEMVDRLLNETGSRGSRRDRAGAFLDYMFPHSKPWVDEDESEMTELLLEAVLVEMRLYDSLPQATPDVTCRGHLYDDRDGFEVSGIVR